MVKGIYVTACQASTKIGNGPAVPIENLVTKGLQALYASPVVREADFELTNRAKRLPDLIATADKPPVAQPLGRYIAVLPLVPRGRDQLRTSQSIEPHVCAAIRRDIFAYGVGYGNCNVSPNGWYLWRNSY